MKVVPSDKKKFIVFIGLFWCIFYVEPRIWIRELQGYKSPGPFTTIIMKIVSELGQVLNMMGYG